MKIKHLIADLEKLNPEAQLYLYNEEWESMEYVTGVEKVTEETVKMFPDEFDSKDPKDSVIISK